MTSPFSFFSSVTSGVSDVSSIASAVSSSSSCSGLRRSADNALKRAIASSQVETAALPSNFPACRQTSRNTSLIRSSAVASLRTSRSTNRNTRT